MEESIGKSPKNKLIDYMKCFTNEVSELKTRIQNRQSKGGGRGESINSEK